jgi:hypothetical protein
MHVCAVKNDTLFFFTNIDTFFSQHGALAPCRACAMEARSDTLEWDGSVDGGGTEASSSSSSSPSSSSSSWQPSSSLGDKEASRFLFQPSSFAESQQSMDGYVVMTSPARADVHTDGSTTVEGRAATAVAAHDYTLSYTGDHSYAVVENVRSDAVVGAEDPDVRNNQEVINDDDDYISIGTC